MAIWARSREMLVISNTPTVSASPNYTANDNMGGLISLEDVGKSDKYGGAGLIQHVTVMDRAAQALQIDVWFFDANPSSSTFTDNAAAVIHSDDAGKVIYYVELATWKTQTDAYSVSRDLAIPFLLQTGNSTLYAALIAQGAHNLAATDDITLKVGILAL
jgi:hypothetical protein